MEQRQHKQALLALDRALCSTSNSLNFQGLTIKLYHPEADRLPGLKVLNPELYSQLATPEKVRLHLGRCCGSQIRTPCDVIMLATCLSSSLERGTCFSEGSRETFFPLQAFVGNDGVIHVVADEAVMQETLACLDFARAQLLSDVSSFWFNRSRSVPRVVLELQDRHIVPSKGFCCKMAGGSLQNNCNIMGILYAALIARHSTTWLTPCMQRIEDRGKKTVA